MSAHIRQGLLRGLVSVVILLEGGAAWAHAAPVHQTPTAGAELTAPPTEIRIEFDDALEPAFSSLSVTDSAGHRVNVSKSQVSPANQKVMLLGVPVLPPGAYRVRWVAVAHDGHRTQGGYAFRVK
ncbi:copper resistance protein [Pandoraea terrae]|uniref:Copper resistance protein n=1 Tax=Pandoraea terrae TaxID=1537710 RepID=A0A5E4ZCI1_9BURK|nr:copper resistance protein CopC [Pandoraea terrae]VVE58312.1 copper resistance protein [Pandoraea terrae]